MTSQKETLERLIKAKDKQERTGYAERNPEIYNNLLLKIEAVKNNNYKIKDVAVEKITGYGGALPLIHTLSEIQCKLETKEKKYKMTLKRLTHFQKIEKDYYKMLDKYSRYKNVEEWSVDYD